MATSFKKVSSLILMLFTFPVNVAFSHEDIIAQMDLSTRGRQQLLEHALNGIVGSLQGHMESAPLTDQLLEADPWDCSDEKMSAMGMFEIWEK